MGTTYNITYFSNSPVNFKPDVEEILTLVNNAASTYLEESTISKFNKSKTFTTSDPIFISLLKKSKVLNETTKGAFEPTVMPLVNLYGFGPNKIP